MKVVLMLGIMWILTTPLLMAQEITQPATPEPVTKVHEVHIPKGADKFEPPVLKIKTGETVTWINEDDRGHPIASIPGQGTNDKELFSAPIAPGKSWSHTFKKAGEYPYFCYIHYVMMGVVFVEDAQGQAQ